MPLHTLKIDPAGNITLLILDPVDPSQRADTAATLMRRDPTIEQVGFVVSPYLGGDGRVEMMGGEFCGNAARAFGFYLAYRTYANGRHSMMVEISGAPQPVRVIADLNAGAASAEMPIPQSLTRFVLEGIEGTLVVFDGISHLVLPCPYSEGVVLAARACYAKRGEDAFGVMFFDADAMRMTPVVMVRSTNTTIFEGSCGSGSVAAGCVLALRQGDGEHRFSFSQPSGTIETVISTQSGRIDAASIGGVVVIDRHKKLV